MVSTRTKVVTRGKDLVSCGNYLLTRRNDLVNHGNGLVFCGNEPQTHANEIKIIAHSSMSLPGLDTYDTIKYCLAIVNQ